eukprot:TRINITY_DN105592_c0_g1_i1.p1 TRINITY_DN105592_c0_g1~~TRINITY_DN105592_c0_g1_i1.p1  ORF type:complete len:268 (-),score=80.22 TRINITY_DN105592_c0_g1_i1:22-825(-)
MSGRPGMDLQHVKNIFLMWDESGNGHVELEEMLEALKKIGVSDSDCKMMFASADVNHDGQVDWEEFVHWLFESDAPSALKKVTRTDEEHMSEKGQALRAAREAAATVQPDAIRELSMQYVPPKGGLPVAAAVLMLLGFFPGLAAASKKKSAKVDVEEQVWTAMKKLLQRGDFRARMQNLDPSRVPAEVVEALDHIAQLGILGWAAQVQGHKVKPGDEINKKGEYDETMDSHKGVHLDAADVAARGSGGAIAGMCGWVENMLKAVKCA